MAKKIKFVTATTRGGYKYNFKTAKGYPSYVAGVAYIRQTHLNAFYTEKEQQHIHLAQQAWKRDGRGYYPHFDRRIDTGRAWYLVNRNLDQNIRPQLKTVFKLYSALLDLRFPNLHGHRQLYFYTGLLDTLPAMFRHGSIVTDGTGFNAYNSIHAVRHHLHRWLTARGISCWFDSIETPITTVTGQLSLQIHQHSVLVADHRLNLNKLQHSLNRYLYELTDYRNHNGIHERYHISIAPFYATDCYGNFTHPLVFGRSTSVIYATRQLMNFVHYISKQANFLPSVKTIAEAKAVSSYVPAVDNAVFNSTDDVKTLRHHMAFGKLIRNLKQELSDIQAVTRFIQAPSAENVLAKIVYQESTNRENGNRNISPAWVNAQHINVLFDRLATEPATATVAKRVISSNRDPYRQPVSGAVARKPEPKSNSPPLQVRTVDRISMANERKMKNGIYRTSINQIYERISDRRQHGIRENDS